jgi:hypothetical protein
MENDAVIVRFHPARRTTNVDVEQSRAMMPNPEHDMAAHVTAMGIN